MSVAIKLLEGIIVRLAALCVVGIMVIVTIDAFSRYLFHSPLPWAFDLIAYYLLIATLYLAISATFQSGDHITIDLFRNMMSKGLRNTLDVIWSLLSAAAFVLIAIGAWREMSHAYTAGEFLPGYFAWPAWASFPPIVIGAGVLSIRLLFHAYQLIAHGDDPTVAESGEHVE